MLLRISAWPWSLCGRAEPGMRKKYPLCNGFRAVLGAFPSDSSKFCFNEKENIGASPPGFDQKINQQENPRGLQMSCDFTNTMFYQEASRRISFL
jgi:hypothetical protein